LGVPSSFFTLETGMVLDQRFPHLLQWVDRNGYTDQNIERVCFQLFHSLAAKIQAAIWVIDPGENCEIVSFHDQESAQRNAMDLCVTAVFIDPDSNPMFGDRKLWLARLGSDGSPTRGGGEVGDVDVNDPQLEKKTFFTGKSSSIVNESMFTLPSAHRQIQLSETRHITSQSHREKVPQFITFTSGWQFGISAVIAESCINFLHIIMRNVGSSVQLVILSGDGPESMIVGL
jgi:hypothetical protein